MQRRFWGQKVFGFCMGDLGSGAPGMPPDVIQANPTSLGYVCRPDKFMQMKVSSQ